MLRFFAHGRRQPPPAAGSSAPPANRADADAHDVALIGRVAHGDVRAFEVLYRTYHPRLSRFLASMTVRRPIVEEALNDTMLVVWNRADSYNHQSKVSTWIFAIAYRTACKALQRQDPPAEEWEPDDQPSPAASPERQHSDVETRAALARALVGLSDEQRSVLVLTYFHDLPYAEIAQILECPIDTVKTRVFHGRRRLRALLTGELRDWL